MLGLCFLSLKKQANVGYSGHKKSLRDGVFSNVGDVDWTKIWSVIFSFLKKEYPGQIVENDTEKWFFKNCWLVAPRDDGRAWATMVTRVLGYAEYLKGNGSLDVDEIVGNGYFCSTLENKELLEGCKNAITKEGAIGYDVITSAIKGFECVRGDRIFRDGYWCYNSFRRGIDLVFRRSNGASQDDITLPMRGFVKGVRLRRTPSLPPSHLVPIRILSRHRSVGCPLKSVFGLPLMPRTHRS